MEDFLNAFALALTPGSIAAIGLGSLVGLIFGSIPGLTFTVALALALPISFSLDAVPAIGLLLGTYIGGMTGGVRIGNFTGYSGHSISCRDSS